MYASIKVKQFDSTMKQEKRKRGELARAAVSHAAGADVTSSQTPQEAHFSAIFAMLRAQTGSDFSTYKRSTIERRVRRRMAFHQIEGLAGYSQFLKQNPAEVAALYEDLLIHVTEFFRDPKTFQVLKASVFPKLLRNRTPDGPIRVWVPG